MTEAERTALVEQVARKLCKTVGDVWELGELLWTDEAADILAIAEPAIRRAALEEAAKVAAGSSSYDDTLQSLHTGATTGQRIAANIRALADRDITP